MDQSDMDFLFYCALIVILFFMLDKIFNRQKPVVNQLEVITNKNGWIHFNWDILLNDNEKKKILDDFINQNCGWSDNFIKNYFHQIYHMNSTYLLNICKELHTNTTLTDTSKDNIKRLITACAVLFNFSIPQVLFNLDKTTLTIILQYYAITRLIKTDINDIDVNLLQESTGADILQMKEIIDVIDQGFFYVSRNANKCPNIIRLMSLIEKNNLKLFKTLNGDINNLKKLLTICYFLSGIYIPLDYFIMDKNIYLYLKDSQYFSKHKYSHLKIV